MGGQLQIKSAKLAALQDSGRLGLEHYGVGVNGAVDMYAYLIGNILIGNSQPMPSIEVTAFDFSMSTNVDIAICVTGAVAELRIDSEPIGAWQTVKLPAGKTLHIKKIRQGLRVYIAVGGGIDVPLTMGSCSWDAVGKIGERIYTGQSLRLINPEEFLKHIGRQAPLKHIPAYGSPWNIHVCPGPDMHIFKDHLEQFFNSTYTVSPNSNHIGIRLDGPPLLDFHPTEVLSKGAAIGGIEIIPTGHPIVLHKGRSVTAGYPILGVVASADLGMIGQARPGDKVKFVYVSTEEAAEMYREKFRPIHDYYEM